MELQYCILWFEDNDRLVKLFKKRISKYLDDLGGFSLDLTHRKNAANFEQYLNKDYDLILVDWNLNPEESGNKLSGEELIRGIRRKEVYTEIIFYSAIDDFAAQEFSLNGVYFTDTDNDNLFSRIQEIVRHTLQRSLRISVTRGLFIASTIDLVEKLEGMISKILKLDGDHLKFFQDYIIQAEFFNDASKYTIIKDFLNQENASLKEKIENAAEGKQKNDLEKELGEIRKIKETFNKFRKDVIELRNHLAHAKPIPDERNSLSVRNKEKRCYEKWEFTLAKCKEIRKKFLVHAENLEKISALLDNSS